jgi:signal transduction histidine kinase
MKGKSVDSPDASDLQDRLLKGGLSVEGWQELVVKSRTPGGRDMGNISRRDAVAFGQLAVLLSRMEDLLEKAETLQDRHASTDALRQTLSALDSTVSGIAAGTQQKIEELKEDVHGKEGTGVSSPARQLPRKEILEILAEIVQELCQPLSVISCSLSMISRERAGKVSPNQVGLLDLAVKSAERMRVLIDSLREISGDPQTLAPDSEIQSWIYTSHGQTSE